ncbi:MAG TPA: ATPase domain-containing protein [Polyangiaceae bacterium]|nr:ATPase domain-containing protein [Polyangiaceae bacterium]
MSCSGGGIPEGNLVFVVGGAGSGKTTLAVQIAMHSARSGGKVVLVFTLSASAARLVKHIRALLTSSNVSDMRQNTAPEFARRRRRLPRH